MKKLVNYKNNILHTNSAVVEKNEDLAELIQDLDKMGTFFSAYGISAIQLGIPKQVFLFRDDILKQFNIAINPQLLEISETGSIAMEGCLSFPNVNLPVARPFMCKVQFENQTRELVEAIYTGLMARVFLHEIDHCFGKTIMDDLSPLKRTMAEKKITKWIKKMSRQDLTLADDQGNNTKIFKMADMVYEIN